MTDHDQDGAEARTRIIELLEGLGSTVLSDALDYLGFDGAMVDIAPLGAGVRMIGFAQTVHQEPRPAGLAKSVISARHQLFVDHEVRPGAVVVVSSPRTPVASSWGYLLSLRSMERGAVGTVVDGSVRDPEAIVGAGYPVFASTTRHISAGSKLRLSTVGVDVPIVCGGVPVEPGDVVVGDDSGVVVCPRALVEEAAAIARRFSRAEDAMEERIRAGGLLSDDPDAA